MAKKDTTRMVCDVSGLPISRTEAKEQIAALRRHLTFTAEEIQAEYVRRMEVLHPGMLKAWQRNDDVPGPEQFE